MPAGKKGIFASLSDSLPFFTSAKRPLEKSPWTSSLLTPSKGPAGGATAKANTPPALQADSPASVRRRVAPRVLPVYADAISAVHDPYQFRHQSKVPPSALSLAAGGGSSGSGGEHPHGPPSPAKKKAKKQSVAERDHGVDLRLLNVLRSRPDFKPANVARYQQFMQEEARDIEDRTRPPSLAERAWKFVLGEPLEGTGLRGGDEDHDDMDEELGFGDTPGDQLNRPLDPAVLDVQRKGRHAGLADILGAVGISAMDKLHAYSVQGGASDDPLSDISMSAAAAARMSQQGTAADGRRRSSSGRRQSSAAGAGAQDSRPATASRAAQALLQAEADKAKVDRLLSKSAREHSIFAGTGFAAEEEAKAAEEEEDDGFDADRWVDRHLRSSLVEKEEQLAELTSSQLAKAMMKMEETIRAKEKKRWFSYEKLVTTSGKDRQKEEEDAKKKEEERKNKGRRAGRRRR